MTSTSEGKPGAARYRIDPGRSRFMIKAFATGMLSAFAHNPTIAIRDFTGEVEFSPDAPEHSSLSIRVQSGSLEVVDEVSDKDRRDMERQIREDVLETERYPEIVFESSAVSADRAAGQYRAKIKGDVTLRGLTRTCEITAQIIAGPDALRAHGEFPLKQSDFNIKPVTAVGGTIKLKDELKFTFDIVAQKQ
ncbi:MAG TPA: YceI family protein [Blastocatellia bacterium]|nr:YceI family protein [Blastocatellia bacterium]